jgi:cyclohexa-1,5-dienecarbonyl-CoA hydratase
MTNYKFIGYRSDNGLIAITINKPPYNVLDIPLIEELNAALDAAAADTSAKAVLITGSGEKAFSAGVEVADHTPDKVDRMIEVFGDTFRRLDRIPVPTVAALNGVALGGGCELAIGCDMIVAASHAKIGQPEIKLGVFPPVAAALLPKLIAPGKAYELILGGENLTADEALKWGLVNKVWPKEELAAGVQTYLAQFLGLSRVALVLAKKALRAAQGRPFFDGLARAEEIYLKELMATEDAKEGLASFMEKRKPVWKNK